MPISSVSSRSSTAVISQLAVVVTLFSWLALTMGCDRPNVEKADGLKTEESTQREISESTLKTAKQSQQLKQLEAEIEKNSILAARISKATKMLNLSKKNLTDKKAELETLENEIEADQKAIRDAVTKKQVEAHAADQAKLALYAAKLFGSLNIDPEILLSKKLQDQGATVEIKGKDRTKILALWKEKDWLGLIKHFDFMHPQFQDEYPPWDRIRHAAEALRKHQFLILITTPMDQFTDKNQLFMVTLKDERIHSGGSGNEPDYSPSSELPTIHVSLGPSPIDSHWEKSRTHPDGIGLIHPWRVVSGRPLFATGDPEDKPSRVVRIQINHEFDQKMKRLETLVELGDLDEAEHKMQVREELQKAHRKGEAWVLGL